MSPAHPGRSHALAIGMLAAVALATAIVPAGDSRVRPTPTSVEGQANTLVVDTVLVLRTLDPARAQEPGGAMAIHHLYSTLLTFQNGDANRLVPSVARSYVVQNQARRFVLTLRPNVRFSNGARLTAADVVFSLMRLKNLKVQNSFLMDGVTARAQGARTVILTSATRNPALPRILASEATSILPSALVRRNGGDASANAPQRDSAENFLNTRPVGSGPYALESASFASQIVLVANRRYFGRRPAFGRVVLRNTPPAQQRLNLIAGDSQLATDVAGSLLEGLPSSVIVRGSTPDRGWYVEMHLDPAVSTTTANARFREAVRYGIDYRGFVRLARLGGTPMPSVVPANFPTALKISAAVQRNVTRARSALAASGIRNPRVTLSYIGAVVALGISFDAVAQKIKSDLDEVGIDVQLEPLAVVPFIQRQQGRLLEMSVRPQRALYVDPSTWLLFSPGEQFALRSGYTVGRSSQAVLTAASQAQRAVNDAQRLARFQTWQRRMNAENGPYAPLFGTSTIIVGSRNLVGIRPTIASWRIDLSELSQRS